MLTSIYKLVGIAQVNKKENLCGIKPTPSFIPAPLSKMISLLKNNSFFICRKAIIYFIKAGLQKLSLRDKRNDRKYIHPLIYSHQQRAGFFSRMLSAGQQGADFFNRIPPADQQEEGFFRKLPSAGQQGAGFFGRMPSADQQRASFFSRMPSADEGKAFLFQ